jgi:hypothetical protein
MQTHLQQSLVISYCSYFEGLKGTYTITCKTGIFTKEKKNSTFFILRPIANFNAILSSLQSNNSKTSVSVCVIMQHNDQLLFIVVERV